MIAHDLNAVAFPKLTDEQMAGLERCSAAKLKRFRDGERLFQVGDRDFRFFVVKSGKVEIVDDSGDAPKTVTVLRPGEFTGDVAQLTGGPALVSAVARGDCEVYEVSPGALREIINLTRTWATSSCRRSSPGGSSCESLANSPGMRVIGSRYSRDTFRVRDFLAKNRVPFTWLDLEADPQVTQLLKQFGVSEADTPVVAWGRKLILRNPSDRELAEALGIRRPLEHTVYDLVVVGRRAGGAGRGGLWRLRGAEHASCWSARGRGARPAAACASRTTSASRPASPAANWPSARPLQANKFGARLAVPSPVTRLTFDGPVLRRCTSTAARRSTAKCLLIATGADYRRLDVEGCERFEGCGVYYAATP